MSARSTSVLAIVAGALACALVASPAHAQRAPDPASTQRVVALLRQGDAAFEVNDFEGALHLYQQAYQLRQEPTILHNVARILVRLGREEEAADTWRRFLERAPNLPNRAEIEGFIREAEVRALLRRNAPLGPVPVPLGDVPAAPNGPAVAPLAPPAVTRVVWPAPAWGLLAVGGAGLLLGGVFGGLHLSERGALHDPSNCTRADDGTYDCDASAMPIAERAATYGNVAWVSLAAGGAVVVGGLVWALAGRRETRATRAVEGAPLVSFETLGASLRARW